MGSDNRSSLNRTCASASYGLGMTKSPRYSPFLTRLEVEGVKLYNDGALLQLDLTKPISAFVGANGIGKSTLLALANFALTGLVPNPSASFQSVDEFTERTSPFAAAYFSGRVDESERDRARVTATFSLGDSTFEVTRGLFEGRLVRSFHVSGVRQPSNLDSPATESQSDLAIGFQEAVVRSSGLANFDQFCFWQLFMMTFDERRHLLFWDERTLQSALLISLGRDPKDAIEAESLTRNIERQESLARNARWRATQATARRSRLSRKVAGANEMSDHELLNLHEHREALEQASAETKQRLEATEVALRDSSRMVAELAIAESSLERSYLTEFSSRKVGKDPRNHSIITSVIRDGLCELCGTHTHTLSHRVTSLLSDSKCPICESQLSTAVEDLSLDNLAKLDRQLSSARSELEDARSEFHRLRDEATQSARNWEIAFRNLEEFLSSNATALEPNTMDTFSDQLLQLDREIASAMRDVETYRTSRDGYHDLLEPIIEGLVDGYEEIEKIFVPNFRRLAEQFIGRTVDVEFERRGVNIGLRFALDGQSRRNATELSESQQYFLDIALRMSLLQTFVDDHCTLLIDTPEGSLDIAYETRAGMLFNQFSNSGHSIFMLSNLNASNLLTKLATLSTGATMNIFKMIEWSRLSDVQLESADLFDVEYDRLDLALQNDSTD